MLEIIKYKITDGENNHISMHTTHTKTANDCYGNKLFFISAVHMIANYAIRPRNVTRNEARNPEVWKFHTFDVNIQKQPFLPAWFNSCASARQAVGYYRNISRFNTCQ